MARAFANISFTPNVKAFQAKMGSRDNYQSFERGENEVVALTDFEKQFISERDSFYQATIAENGWPYVQHRGGPIGFVKILSDQTIAYPDFSGNRQYISAGNLIGDNRISLILMDYQQQRRLKIWGRARLVDELTEPELVAQIEPIDSRAPIERAVVIEIEAFDWNCPKYITPRFTQADVNALISDIESGPKQAENVIYDYQGTASIPLTITAIRQLSNDIRSYEFKHSHNENLPDYSAGAHITVPIMLADGSKTSRSYSLTNDYKDKSRYTIAVKKENHENSASAQIHRHWQLGMQISIEKPENYFSLHTDSRPTVLIAGGIGITPIKAMADELSQHQSSFELHYTAKSIEEMAFFDHLSTQFVEATRFYFTQQTKSQRLDLKRIFSQASKQAIFYICGPNRLLNESLKVANQLNIARERIHFESFK